MSTLKNTVQPAPAIDLATLSVDELEALLQQKKQTQQQEWAEKRSAYEEDREKLINFLGDSAATVAEQMGRLKFSAMRRLVKWRERMLEYGDLRRGDANKGSFEIKNEYYKIQFASQINKHFDERAELAEKKLKDFLTSFVRNRDKKMYAIIQALLERNPKTGDFDISLINRLYTMEDSFDDPNWKDAIRLFKESYSPTGTAQYVRFSRKLQNGSWEAIVLDFAKVKAIDIEQPNPTSKPN